jgi:hypothetical protein
MLPYGQMLEVAFIYEIAIYVASLLLCNIAPTFRKV